MPARIPTRRLLFELQRVAKQLNRPPSASDFDQYSQFTKGTVSNRFASWPAARRAAGLQGTINRAERTRIAESVLLADLRELARDIGKIPAAVDMDEHGDRSATTYQRRFGTWKNAREKAGFPDENRFKIQSGELLRGLREFADEIGHTPTQGEMGRDGPYFPQTFHNRFGTYNSALKAAGLSPNHEQNIKIVESTTVYGRNWKSQRKKTLARDDWQCVVCGTTQEDHKRARNMSLHVHHIEPSRDFDPPEDGNQLDNLVTLCIHCHGQYENFPDELARDRR